MMSCSVFVFKQKTANVLRIIDWSSDVFSSDLRNGRAAAAAPIYISGLFSPFGLTGCMTQSLSPRVEAVFWFLLTATGYFLLASLSLHATKGADNMAAVWPASGYVLALLLLMPEIGRAHV